jgi:hypothetical protein
MPKTLKQENRLALSAVLGLNLAFLAILLNMETLDQLPNLNKSTLLRAGAAALAFPFTRLVVELAKRETKEALIFWGRPLPTYRMVQIGQEDHAVDMAQLATLNGMPLPVAPDAQHRLYMRWYRWVKDDPSVTDAFGDYLFFRDWLATACLLGLFFSPLVLITRGWQFGLIFLIAELAQFGVVTLAARNANERMIRNVLGVVSTAPPATFSEATAPPKP